MGTSNATTKQDKKDAKKSSVKKSFDYKSSEKEADKIAEGFKGSGDVKKSMESRLGVDFSGIRLHKNSAQPEKHGKAAIAKGRDIHFAPGAYQPQTPTGRMVIAHELAHTMQQGTAKGGEGSVSAPAPVGTVQGWSWRKKKEKTKEKVLDQPLYDPATGPKRPTFGDSAKGRAAGADFDEKEQQKDTDRRASLLSEAQDTGDANTALAAYYKKGLGALYSKGIGSTVQELQQTETQNIRTTSKLNTGQREAQDITTIAGDQLRPQIEAFANSAVANVTAQQPLDEASAVQYVSQFYQMVQGWLLDRQSLFSKMMDVQQDLAHGAEFGQRDSEMADYFSYNDVLLKVVQPIMLEISRQYANADPAKASAIISIANGAIKGTALNMQADKRDATDSLGAKGGGSVKSGNTEAISRTARDHAKSSMIAHRNARQAEATVPATPQAATQAQAEPRQFKQGKIKTGHFRDQESLLNLMDIYENRPLNEEMAADRSPEERVAFAYERVKNAKTSDEARAASEALAKARADAEAAKSAAAAPAAPAAAKKKSLFSRIFKR